MKVLSCGNGQTKRTPPNKSTNNWCGKEELYQTKRHLLQTIPAVLEKSLLCLFEAGQGSKSIFEIVLTNRFACIVTKNTCLEYFMACCW